MSEKKGFWRSIFSKSASQAEPEPSALDVSLDEPHKASWLGRLKAGLSKSSSFLEEHVGGLFTKRKLDDASLLELEDLLIMADMGVPMAQACVEKLKERRFDKEVSIQDLKEILRGEIVRVLAPCEETLSLSGKTPRVVLVVGVNGSGKTTTIGKLGQRAVRDGLQVMLAAGDTFRAAAVEQLHIWGERIGAPVFSRPLGADAAGLAFDALKAAQAAQSDVLFIDTAGRLHNKKDLMAELEKIVRVLKKVDPQLPHAVLLVLDATVGQNALLQTEFFLKSAGVTGLVMTKLDGTARGGILVALAERFQLPIHAIGVGEGSEDLEAFEAASFAEALVGSDGT